ncbi:heparin lyase I family protein [Paraburkholderia bannensis]|uniref:heparin lyase I family protein n=1 Tax=Paraburkholderia bannensis TaxID=765414 RepID=UPI0009FFB977|nr:heparin lyase I family protein [Paraburkholderia bannensis]
MAKNRKYLWGLMGFFVGLCSCAGSEEGARYEQIYRSDWGGGIDSRLVIQAPQGAISIVENPVQHRSMLKVVVHRSDDFSGVANGTPRGEIAFAKIFRYSLGKTYDVNWSTLIPDDYKFDSLQPELFSQILQGKNAGLGSPPFSIRFVDGKYEVEIRNARDAKANVFTFGNPQADKGRLVRWRLLYRPDSTGRDAVTDLYMNDIKVVHCSGCGNAYENDNDAYFKIGIYKWWWKTRPSDVNARSLYFGDVDVKGY